MPHIRPKIEQQGWLCKWVLCVSLKLWHMVDHKCDYVMHQAYTSLDTAEKILNLNSGSLSPFINAHNYGI